MNKIPSTQRELVGLLPDLDDNRDFLFSSGMKFLTFPKKVDLREYTREIENQGTTNSCVANAAVSALELMAYRDGSGMNFSRLFLYYNVRAPYPKLRGRDEGAYVSEGFKQASKIGICPERTWTFSYKNVNTKPSANAYKEAFNHKVLEYRRVNVKSQGTDGIKAALSSGYPVIIGVFLGKGFARLKGPLHLQSYTGCKNQADYWGGHAMNIVGYDDNLNGGSYILENSWGSSWGDNGFGAIPYDVMFEEGRDAW